MLPLLIAIGVGLVFGLVFGCGNRHSFVAAILPTLFFSLLAAGFWLHNRDWNNAGVAATACVVGALICATIPETTRFKRLLNGQHNLHIKLGPYYEFGREAEKGITDDHTDSQSDS